MTEKTPILYIIVRNDLASLTPGRVAAMTSHATSQMHELMHKIKEDVYNISYETDIINIFNIWKQEDINFGTTIVLSESYSGIINIFSELLDSEKKLEFGKTTDPSYGVNDGTFIHYVSVDTCIWIFGYKEDIYPYVAHLPLY